MDIPFIFSGDSYKYTHHTSYPEGTTKVYSYLESRGGRFSETVFFGLQYYLTHYLEGIRVTPIEVEHARDFFKKHFGNDYFNYDGWMYIAQKLGGRLPLRVCAVPEGTVVPTHNVLMTVENTDPKCFWLGNFAETLLQKVWYTMTVATLSREFKKVIKDFLVETSDVDIDAVLPFKLHDFGYRGVSSVESAALGGAAHLVNFMGTDTIAGILLLQTYYSILKDEMYGFSVPASEHSTMTAWTKENEAQAIGNMLEKFPTGIVSIVSDQYDIYNACSKIFGEQLQTEVLSRQGVTVVRPDSGDPTIVVPNILGILGEKFGYSTNSRGYRVLNPKIAVIQGDGIGAPQTVYDILRACQHRGWAASNLTFGSGGALLQKVDRDTQKVAVKASYVEVNGERRDIWKDPITDPGKMSKRGRVFLAQNDSGEYYSTSNPLDSEHNVLQVVFDTGQVFRRTTIEQIRERAKL